MSGKRLLGFVAIFDVIALLILYPHLDVFSVGYLVLSTALAVLQAIASQRLSASEEIHRLFYAKDIDKAFDKWTAPLGVAEFAVFVDYSHWRLMPELVNHSAQTAGLLLCLAGTVWLVWVDSFLMTEFAAHYRQRALLTTGPYRFVRHPRYAGLLGTRLALPLIFGSIIAWAVAICWFILVRRRAHLEEKYLSGQFGAVYGEYARHTLGIL